MDDHQVHAERSDKAVKVDEWDTAVTASRSNLESTWRTLWVRILIVAAWRGSIELCGVVKAPGGLVRAVAG